MDAIPFAPRRRFFFAAPAPARQLVRPNPRPRPRPPANPARPLPKKIRGALSGLSLGVFFCIFSRGVPPDCGLAENRPPVVLISCAGRPAPPGRQLYHLGGIAGLYGRFTSLFFVQNGRNCQAREKNRKPTPDYTRPTWNQHQRSRGECVGIARRGKRAGRHCGGAPLCVSDRPRFYFFL